LLLISFPRFAAKLVKPQCGLTSPLQGFWFIPGCQGYINGCAALDIPLKQVPMPQYCCNTGVFKR